MVWNISISGGKSHVKQLRHCSCKKTKNDSCAAGDALSKQEWKERLHQIITEVSSHFLKIVFKNRCLKLLISFVPSSSFFLFSIFLMRTRRSQGNSFLHRKPYDLWNNNTWWRTFLKAWKRKAHSHVTTARPNVCQHINTTSSCLSFQEPQINISMITVKH